MNDDAAARERIAYAVENYADTVFKVAFQYLSNRQDAEDIVQEVFLGLVERLKKYPFDDGEHMKAWLIRVAINKSINAAKYNSRRRTQGLEGIAARSESNLNCLEDELKKLPAEDREIIYLFYYEGYSAKEIASMTGKRESAVHKRLSRAREKLKNFLKED